MISEYSFANAVVLFNISLILVFLLRRIRGFILGYGIQMLLLITSLGLVRLLMPVEIVKAHIIRSENILPALVAVLRLPIIGTLSVGVALLYIWGIGSTFFIVLSLVRIIKDGRERARYERSDDSHFRTIADRMGIKTPIIVSARVGEPYVAGIFRNKIYLPPLELSDRDIEFILMHEVQHIKGGDQPIKLLFLIIRALFWWNPVAHIFLRELDVLLELRCDKVLAERLGEEARIEYCSSMVNIMSLLICREEKENAPVSAFFGDKSGRHYDIKQRFDALLNLDKRKSRGLRSCLCTVIVIVFLASYLVIIQPAMYPPDEELEGVYTDYNDMNTFILYDGESYKLYYDNKFFMELDESELDDEPHNSMRIIYSGGELPAP